MLSKLNRSCALPLPAQLLAHGQVIMGSTLDLVRVHEVQAEAFARAPPERPQPVPHAITFADICSHILQVPHDP